MPTKKLYWLTLVGLLLLTLQIILGTQVREQIDEISKQFMITNEVHIFDPIEIENFHLFALLH